MQPPIVTGTILQNRYGVLGILGQGGFGRTYLAEDRGRFNERCAIKEFIPAQGSSDYALEKSRELFQREAAILYKIQHPQVPQFRSSVCKSTQLVPHRLGVGAAHCVRHMPPMHMVPGPHSVSQSPQCAAVLSGTHVVPGPPHRS